MKILKKKLSITLLVFLVSITLSALAGGTDTYNGQISTVANWSAKLSVSDYDNYAVASTTIYPYSSTTQLYCQVDLYIIQRNPVTQHNSVKESHIVADYKEYGSTGVPSDSGYYIIAASSYHEAYCDGYFDSTDLGVMP